MNRARGHGQSLDMATITLTTDEFEALVAEKQSLQDRLRVVTVERDLLQERLKAFLRKLFAAKSEARGSDQHDLFLNEAEALAPIGTPVAQEADAGIEVAGHPRKKRGRKPLDPALPREIVRHELPEAQRVCAHDGAALVEMGVEISEQLDIIPQQVRVIQHQRVKYACPCCDESIKVTPAPTRIIPKGLLTEAALAWIVTSKYQDALPLYRQAALLSRFGGDLSRNTLAASVVRLGEAVQPVINLLRDHLLDSDIVHGDETVVQNLLLRHLHGVLPQSLFGKALHYLHGQWAKLIRYLDNGAWPISNNPCENAIRPFVVGRRNWLFADTVGGAHASANLYSLIETCKANGIDPYGYLVKLFQALPTAQTADDFEALLPWHLMPKSP